MHRVILTVVFVAGFDVDSSKGADGHLRLQGTRESSIGSYFGALSLYVRVSFADYA